MDLSGFAASPTLDLGGGRLKNAFSKPFLTAASTTAAPATEASISPLTRTTISIEYTSLRYHKHCPTGIYVTPSAESMLVWDAVLFVHKGYYAGAVFKFVMVFPDNYPTRPPTVRFVTDVFHPLVASQTGLLNLAARCRPWRPKEHRVHDILYFVKTAFKEAALEKLNEMDVVNKEAFKFMENKSSFAALAQQCSQLSQSPSALYDVPSSKKAYSFRFAPMKSEQVDRVLETLSIQTPSHGLSS